MTIHDWVEKIKPVAAKAKPLYTLMLLVVVAALFFALGRFSALEEQHSPLRVYNGGTVSQIGAAVEATLTGTTTNATTGATNVSAGAEIPANTAEDGEVIGSKTGKKYYFPWCGTIKRVKPENQVVFASIATARAAGYLPAGNCKGLQ